MKTVFHSDGFLCAALLVLTLVVNPSLAAPDEAETPDRVTITNGEWPPYLGEDQPHYGIASRIVTNAFEQVGIEVEYDFFPWSRSLYLAERGDRDGTAVWFPSEERGEQFHVSDPVIVSEYVFFHRSDMDFDWRMPVDLQDYQIGITRNYDYGELFHGAVEAGIISTEVVSSDELNFQKLLAGRIDLFPVDRVVGLHMIENELTEDEAERLTWHPKPIRSDRLHLLLSREVPENERRIEAFNQGLRELREANEVERYLTEALGRRVAPDSLSP